MRVLRPARTMKPLDRWDMAVIHCSGGDVGSRSDWDYVCDLQAYCMKPKEAGGRNMQTGAYHTIVLPSGYVYHYRPWHLRGQHAKHHNWHSVGFSFAGNLDEHPPTMPAFEAMAVEVARYLVWSGNDCTHETVQPHNQLIHPSERQKTCPGIMCGMWLLRRKVAGVMRAWGGFIPRGSLGRAPIVTPLDDGFSTWRV